MIPGEHPDVVRNQIDLVRNQQTKILERLKNEETALEQELDEGMALVLIEIVFFFF